MAYNIKIEVFEGPFDLLFHLIEKNEVDIYDIPIAEITEQYLEYLYAMQQLDLEVASEFLVMAANLLSIKARMLLPKPPRDEEEEDDELAFDPRDELVERLLEYKKFKEIANYLKDMESSQGKVYTRLNEESMFKDMFTEENPLQGIELGDLLKALKDILDRVEEEEFAGEIPREEVRVRDKMREIMRRLVFQPNGINFKDLFRPRVTKVEIVVTFMALLELIKLKKVQVHQSKVFGEITIYGRSEEIA